MNLNMLEKFKTIRRWFINIWNKLVGFFKKQKEIPVVVEPVKPVPEEPVKSAKPVQTKKSK
jgi:hypothetical protein